MCRPRIDVSEEALRYCLMTNESTLSQLMEIRTPREVKFAKLAAIRCAEAHLARMDVWLTTVAGKTVPKRP